VPHHYVQDNAVILWVLVVLVGAPIPRPDMNLNIPFHYPAAGGNDGVPEVSTPAIVNSSRVDYSYWLAVISDQLCSVPQQLLPEVNDLTFREIVYTPYRHDLSWLCG
jgi:hypothetical protein